MEDFTTDDTALVKASTGAEQVAAQNAQEQVDVDPLSGLKNELEALTGTSFVQAKKLVEKEIKRLETKVNPDHIDLCDPAPVKFVQKIIIPAERYPDANFVGKLIGPNGATMRKLQNSTGAKLAIFGRGSIRDKDEEEQKRKQGGIYAHLNEPLHVNVDIKCAPAELFQRMSSVTDYLNQYFDPNFEDMEQLQQMGFSTNGASGQFGRGGRGGQRGGRGRGQGRGGGQRGRGGFGGPAQSNFQSQQQDYSGYNEQGANQWQGNQYDNQAKGGMRGGRGGGPMRGQGRFRAARPAPYQGGRGGGGGQQNWGFQQQQQQAPPQQPQQPQQQGMYQQGQQQAGYQQGQQAGYQQQY